MSGHATFLVEVRSGSTWHEVPYEGQQIELEDRVEERAIARFGTVVAQSFADAFLLEGAAMRVLGPANPTREVLFVGRIVDADGNRVPYSDLMRVDVTSVNNHAIADDRLVAKSYENETTDAIVRDIVDTYLAGEGVSYTAQSLMAGPLLREAVFSYVPASKAFRRLAEVSGAVYRIDKDGVIWLQPREDRAAPFTVTPDLVVRDSISVRRSNGKYRNRQVIRGAKNETDPLTEIFHGDGERRAYTVGFPLARVPTVRVNGVEQSPGIKGIEDDRPWLWNRGDAIVTHNHNEPALTASDSLEVTYRGEFDLIAVSEDLGEQLRLSQLRGGEGIVDSVDEVEPTVDRVGTVEYAGALLKRWANMGRRVTLDLRQGGLEAGQLVQVDLPAVGMSAPGGGPVEAFVESVVTRPSPRSPLHTVTLAEGWPQGSWAEIFREIAEASAAALAKLHVGEEGVLLQLATFTESIGWAETSATVVYACPIPSATTYPSGSLYPC